MPGPFVRAVKNAIDKGTDLWAIEWYKDEGRWPPSRADTFEESEMARHGPDFAEHLKLSYHMAGRETARQRVRDEVNALPF